MDASNLRNPYDPPAARAASSPAAPTIAPYAKITRYAPLVSVGACLLYGAVFALRFASALQRFDALEFMPRVIILSAIRSLGAASALSWTCLTAVTIVHRASRDGAGVVETSRRGAWSVGATVALVYPLNIASIGAGALAAMRVVYRYAAADFFASCATRIYWSDVVFGSVETAMSAVLAALVLPRVLRVVASSRSGLFVKLLVTWLALGLSSFLIQTSVVTAWPTSSDAAP